MHTLLALLVTFVFCLIPWMIIHKTVTNQKKLFKGFIVGIYVLFTLLILIFGV